MSASEADEGSSREPLSGPFTEIHNVLLSIQQDYRRLAGTVEAIQGKVNVIGGIKQVRNAAVVNLTKMINYSLSSQRQKNPRIIKLQLLALIVLISMLSE